MGTPGCTIFEYNGADDKVLFKSKITFLYEKERFRETQRNTKILNKRLKKDIVEVAVNNVTKAIVTKYEHAEVKGSGDPVATNPKNGNIQAFMNEKEPPKYKCSLTQGDKAATLFFIGDYVVHTGTTKQGPRLGRVVKVLKKTVQVKINIDDSDTHYWNIKDIVKSDRIGNITK